MHHSYWLNNFQDRVSDGIWLFSAICFPVPPVHAERAFATQSKRTLGIAVEQTIPDSPITHLCGK